MATHAAREATDAVAGQWSQAWSSHSLCWCQPKDLQGDDSTCKGCLTISPCNSCDPQGMDGKDEFLHQLLLLHQPLALHQPLIQEVQILSMVRRKFPGEVEAGPEISQANSCWEGTVDINFFEYQKTSWVTLHQRGTAQEWTRSPSCARWKCQVTFTEGRATLLGKSPRHRARECHTMPRQKWAISCPHHHGGLRQHHKRWKIGQDHGRRPKPPQSKRKMWNLNAPQQLKPYLQWLLGEGEPTLAGAEVGDCLLPLLTPSLPSSLLPLEDPEASPLHASDRIEWHARYVQMLSWWEELAQIPGHVDHQGFAQKVCTSFEVCKAYSWVKKVENYHMQPLTHHSISKYCFLLPKDARYGTQNIHISQLQHTVAYARPLQYWTEEVYPPVPGQPHHLVRSVQELWQAMELLISFKEEEVFMTMVSSNWTEVTSPWLTETSPQESWKSHTQSSRACPRGAMSATDSEGQPATAAM